MELLDRAQMEIERTLERSIINLKAQKSQYKSTGVCLYCGHPLTGGKRWCDSDCRDDFLKYCTGEKNATF